MRGPWLGLVVAAWAAPQCPAGGGCKLELGTWAERLGELVEGIAAAGTLDAARGQAAEVLRWLDLQASFVQESSSPLGPAAASVLAATERDDPFPEGMDMNWALDVQSAQALDFFAAMHPRPDVAWDLGMLTGISAAVLSGHFARVFSVERSPVLAAFGRKHLPANVTVVEAEVLAFLQERAAAGEQADFVFMDLDKPLYLPCYEIIMENGLLRKGGVLLADNVLYRGLTAQHSAGEMPEVSAGTERNAASLAAFTERVRTDVHAGRLRALVVPVRDGMLAVKQH